MNIHAVTFEQLLQICASLEDEVEMQRMAEALSLLEKNVRYLRLRLIGRLQQEKQSESTAREQERRARKKKLRVVGPGNEPER